MTDLLAIIDDARADERVVEEIVRGHPHRVTLLLEDGVDDTEGAETTRASAARQARLTALRATIEHRTGAVIVGLAGSREQLRGWRFDRVVGGPGPALNG